MTRYALAVLGVLAFAGCAQKAPPGAPPPAPVAPNAEKPAANKYLAYEHTLGIDADNDKVTALAEAAQAACNAAAEDSCAVLESRISRGEYSHASLRFRAKSTGIAKLVAVLSSQGKVSEQSTKAEDLAGPIEDTAKKLAMLTSYRGQLESLRVRGSNDVETLMKLTREVSEVQGEIEALSGNQAYLIQRVETEILNVSISSSRTSSSWSPIGSSLEDFGEDFAIGIATVITALAYLIPWSALLLLIGWGVRKLWRRRRASNP